MSPSQSRPLILFVDDEPDVVEILARTFERTYDVLTAVSGEGALQVLRKRPVDILVTDQKMPDMSGIELIARARREGLDITPILLTGYSDPADLVDAINLGHIYRYVTKPWDQTELMVTLKNAVDHHRLRREREQLLAELSKRVDALNLLYEVSRSGAALSSYEAIIGRVVEGFARIIPFDLGASLVAVAPGQAATLQLYCHSERAEAGLLGAKEETLLTWAGIAGAPLGEDRVVTRISGRRAQGGATEGWAPRSRIAATLTIDDRPAGVIALFSGREGFFAENDARLLDLLANQTAGAVRSLTAVLGAERRRMERMVECMADGVILTDARNELLVMNPAAKALLKVDAPDKAHARYLQQTLGFYPFELVRGWEYGGAQQLREEVTIFDRTLHSTVSPVTDAQGALSGVVVLLRDITEQKQLEARKEEFVSIVSHELRTPLTAISGALDLVLNNIAGDINDKQRRFLEMAKDSTDKLNAMVDDLLDLSKFARGKLRMSFEVVYLDELVRAAADRYGAAIQEKRLSLDLKLPQSPVKVVGDPTRLTQVLNNLLTNAVKFCAEGGRVELDLRRPDHIGGHAVVSCWNNGDAIGEGDLERIFDKFEQGGSVRTRSVRGTGLGLAICRSIVEAHGGRIWAESAEGRGARFVVVLPLEPSVDVLRGEEGAPALKPGAPARPGTILVVDDEPDIAYILKALLLGRGHRVFAASRAEEAVALARRHRPDVIASDVRMPEVDGLALVEILRHDPDTRGAKVLVFSVFDERERAFQAGASAFLQKPLDVPRFLATVDGLLAQARDGRPSAKVLVVDDDSAVRAICSEVLTNIGYQVLSAKDLAGARKVLQEDRPQMLLLDVVLPDGDGFAFLEEVHEERSARHLSVIFITARSETASKVRALRLGADDYLVKPFDALELAARVETVLRRKEAELGASPTTGLPGSAAIEREVQRRLDTAQPFALCYLDLDNLKAYNDHYGYAKADGVVQQTGDLLRQVVGGAGEFVGHVAGDDFVFVAAPERVDDLCQQLVEAFDRIIPLYYDGEDRRRGFIEADDRFGQRRQFPIMGITVAAVVNQGQFKDHAELSRAAAELKKRAKLLPGSKFVRSDREEVRRARPAKAGEGGSLERAG